MDLYSINTLASNSPQVIKFKQYKTIMETLLVVMILFSSFVATRANYNDPAMEKARSTAITGGSTYTRWGRTECQNGAEYVYDGFVAGAYFNYGGGDSPGWLCLAYEPTYATEETPTYRSFVYSTEYATDNDVFSLDTQNYDAPCVICHVPRTAQLVIPGQTQCPSSWTMEYGGYLMTSETSDERISKDYICVDGYPEVRPASQDNTGGAQLYFAVMGCHQTFLPCGSDGYKDAVALSCVVCTA